MKTYFTGRSVCPACFPSWTQPNSVSVNASDRPWTESNLKFPHSKRAGASVAYGAYVAMEVEENIGNKSLSLLSLWNYSSMLFSTQAAKWKSCSPEDRTEHNIVFLKVSELQAEAQFWPFGFVLCRSHGLVFHLGKEYICYLPRAWTEGRAQICRLLFL